jgi:RHS repeat-associated protein
VDSNRPYAQVLEEYEDENLKVRYVHGLDLISVERDGEVSVYLVDGLGSTRVLTDLDGEVVATYTYDAFGELLGSTGEVENDYLFAGEQFDGELEQYYLRQRFYDAGVGRFTRRDTWEGGLNDPLSLHKYQYAHLNPVNNIDPTGLFTINDVLAGLEVLDTLVDVASFIADPSFSGAFLFLLGAIGFPPGLDKAFKNIYGGNAKNIANGLEAGLKSLGGTELRTASKLQDAGLVNLLADKNLGKLYKKVDHIGKKVDVVSVNPSTNKLIFSETKATLSEKSLRTSFEGLENGGDKFSSSIQGIKKFYEQGGESYEGTEELIIFAERIKDNLHPWAVLSDGSLTKNGSPVIIDGVQVIVKQL